MFLKMKGPPISGAKIKAILSKKCGIKIMRQQI